MTDRGLTQASSSVTSFETPIERAVRVPGGFDLGDARAERRRVVRKAIILAAGAGNRLRPFTDHSPKCLAPVAGVPILVNALTHLADVGIREVVIVVGHLKQKICERIGCSFKGMEVAYVESDDYAKTNNIYSLWLARRHLDQDLLLLEGDVFFERRVLDRMLSREGENLAAVSQYQPWMSGTVVNVDAEGKIQALLETQHQRPDFDYSETFKTANIYLLRADFLRRYFVPHLGAFIAAGDVDEYYEAILETLAYRKKHDMRAVRCDDLRWYEIDDESDRLTAEYLFSTQEKRYEFVARQHGGYWRYDFVDHAYLYNLYFPPEPVFAHFRNHLRDLVHSYPVSQDVLGRLVGTLIEQPPERIVVANGASEIIRIIARRLDRRLIVPVPSFNEYENAAPEGRLVRFALSPPSFELDVDGFAAEVVQHEAAVAVVVTPNNPTSLAVPRSHLLRLLERLSDRDCMLVVDESFVDFVRDRDRATLEGDLEDHPNLAILKSMSKAYGIAGLRLGYLLTANHDFAESVRKEIPIWNVNGFAESFLQLSPRYRREFARSCDRVRADRNDLCEGLSTIPGLAVYPPDANFVFCRLPDWAANGPDVTRLLFVRSNILIKHCAGKTMPDSDRYIRVASRTKAENRVLVEALGEIVDRQGVMNAR